MACWLATLQTLQYTCERMMKEFKEKADCEKCGWTNIVMTWIDVSAGKNYGEHLQCKCARCSYPWVMKTKPRETEISKEIFRSWKPNPRVRALRLETSGELIGGQAESE